MTRREAIDLFIRCFGGTTKLRPRKAPARDVWEWKLYGYEALRLAKALLPFLQIKREQAEVAIRFQEHMIPFRWRGPIPLSIEEIEAREAFRAEMQKLNRRGKLA